MTSEELIIRHFEGSLSADEERALQERLSQSAETRTMYEHHGNLDAMLATDAGALAPSSRLDEATLGAALAVLPEVVGGGALSWLSGKLVAVVSAVVIGGTTLVVVSNQTPEPSAPARAVPAPVAPAQAVPAQAAPAPAVTAPATTAAPEAEAVTRDVSAAKATPERANGGVASAGRSQQRDTRANQGRGRRLTIDGNATVVDHGTTMKPDGK